MARCLQRATFCAFMKLLFSYTTLPNTFFSKIKPRIYPHPKLILFNADLADNLGIDYEDISERYWINTLLGYHLPKTQSPVAQAYAGHQFGHFTMLGDGRAMLLGEIESQTGKHLDIQLKGSGPTPYSRNADGNATLGSMLREYLISEAMHALRIPTTRSLAVIDTGEIVHREQLERGAILVRVAKSHIRVGTFEYARIQHDKTILQALLTYTIHRHYPELNDAENPALALLNAVIKRQADLITEWMRVGFIHGVMNTDNMAISGETLDYGPCAFMNCYNVDSVFSSIDRNGRYAYGNQPYMAKWNIARFAEALLPLLADDEDSAVALAEKAVNQFDTVYEKKWLRMMSHKLGLVQAQSVDKDLIDGLLSIMQRHALDYTNTFYALTYEIGLLKKINKADMDKWIERWKLYLKASNRSIKCSQTHMQQYNPVIIPRNHLVEAAIQAVEVDNNVKPVTSLIKLLRKPYQLIDNIEHYQTVPPDFDDTYQTFCGT